MDTIIKLNENFNKQVQFTMQKVIDQNNKQIDELVKNISKSFDSIKIEIPEISIRQPELICIMCNK